MLWRIFLSSLAMIDSATITAKSRLFHSSPVLPVPSRWQTEYLTDAPADICLISILSLPRDLLVFRGHIIQLLRDAVVSHSYNKSQPSWTSVCEHCRGGWTLGKTLPTSLLWFPEKKKTTKNTVVIIQTCPHIICTKLRNKINNIKISIQHYYKIFICLTAL